MDQLSRCFCSSFRCVSPGLEFGPPRILQAWILGRLRYATERTAQKRRLHGVSEHKGGILIDVIRWQVTAIDGATGALDDGRCFFEVKIAAYDRIR